MPHNEDKPPTPAQARQKLQQGLVGNSTFDAARISRFEITRVSVPWRWRTFHGLGAAFFCVRSSDITQFWSYAVPHSRVVASRLCGANRVVPPSVV